jgi:hypothetical protein
MLQTLRIPGQENGAIVVPKVEVEQDFQGSQQ